MTKAIQNLPNNHYDNYMVNNKSDFTIISQSKVIHKASIKPQPKLRLSISIRIYVYAVLWVCNGLYLSMVSVALNVSHSNGNLHWEQDWSAEI